MCWNPGTLSSLANALNQGTESLVDIQLVRSTVTIGVGLVANTWLICGTR